MRITPSITARNFLAGVENLNEALETATSQISSGKKLNRLGDSPSGSAELVLLKNQQAGLDRYTANADNTAFVLNVADSALSGAYDLVTAIFARGSAAASETNNPGALEALGDEIGTLRDQLLQLANTQANGRSIFAGTNVTEPAFTASGDTLAYQGNSEVNCIDIGESLEVRQNIPGGAVFMPVFEKVNELMAAIGDEDFAAIRAALSDWAPALSGISQARVQLGADLRKLENGKLANDAQELNIRTRRAAIEDADLAKSVTDLSQAQTALKATLTAQAAVRQYNLFDFLG